MQVHMGVLSTCSACESQHTLCDVFMLSLCCANNSALKGLVASGPLVLAVRGVCGLGL